MVLHPFLGKSSHCFFCCIFLVIESIDVLFPLVGWLIEGFEGIPRITTGKWWFWFKVFPNPAQTYFYQDSTSVAGWVPNGWCFWCISTVQEWADGDLQEALSKPLRWAGGLCEEQEMEPRRTQRDGAGVWPKRSGYHTWLIYGSYMVNKWLICLIIWFIYGYYRLLRSWRWLLAVDNWWWLGFHSHGGAPIAGWFLRKIPSGNGWWFRGTPILRKLPYET